MLRAGDEARRPRIFKLIVRLYANRPVSPGCLPRSDYTVIVYVTEVPRWPGPGTTIRRACRSTSSSAARIPASTQTQDSRLRALRLLLRRRCRRTRGTLRRGCRRWRHGRGSFGRCPGGWGRSRGARRRGHRGRRCQGRSGRCAADAQSPGRPPDQRRE